jgi:hypothetical protein
MNRILGLILTAALAGTFAVSSQASMASTPRSGTLHVKKECSGYTGKPGSFCRITASNLAAITVGSKVVYATPDPGSDTDITLYAKGAKAFGHVMLNPKTGVGTVTFSGGTGTLAKFKADLVVRPVGDVKTTVNWRWDGTFSYVEP